VPSLCSAWDPSASMQRVVIGIHGSNACLFVRAQIPVPVLAPLVRLLISRPLARCSLLVLGFNSLSIQTRPPRTVASSKNTRRTRPEMASGDVIVSNHCSFVDVLFLYVMRDAAFVQLGTKVSGCQRMNNHPPLGCGRGVQFLMHRIAKVQFARERS